MRDGVKRDFDWQLRFLPTIRRLVGPWLLEPAPLDLDMAEATDLVMLGARDLRIGCRVRRRKDDAGRIYAERFPWDFTLRSKRDTGATTELEKITNGWGDLLFYGHEASEQSNDIERWFLINLASWRSHLMRRTVLWGTDIPNGDGTYFRKWDVRDFTGPPPICLAASHPIPAPSVSIGQASSMAA
jgi:hypothetical protein